MRVSFQNVNKSYGQGFSIRDLNLDLESEKTTTLIGPSGSGKSTILRMVIGLVEPDSGNIKFNNEIISKNNLHKLRQDIGYVRQGGGLFPHLSAEENIVLAAKEFNYPKDYISARLNELLRLTDLKKDLMNKYPHQLSGGQIQRVSIMRALMLDPSLILLDEPLVGLDPGTNSNLKEDLKAIFTNLKKTVLLVTHEMEAAEFLSDKIFLVSEGKLSEKDSSLGLDWSSMVSSSIHKEVEKNV